MLLRAIQIVTAVAGIITTVYQHNNGPSLRDVFLADDVEDLPILVFSITGKTRGGKSFLLNSMIQYLEANGRHGWWNEPIHNVFEWKSGVESITKGLWIYPKIYKHTNINNQKVGILLLDSQGLFDGEQSDGESVVLSGISTAISSLQMFNLKEKITSDDLLNIHLYLVDGMDKAELKSTSTRFMFVVRDFMGSEDIGVGLVNGQKYINMEKDRGTAEHREKWQILHNTFSKIECLLLPHPGLKIQTAEFKNSGKLSELDLKFISELGSFFKTIFGPENLITNIDTPTGKTIYSTLNQVNGKKSDNIRSFFHMFTEEGNEYNLGKLIDQFKERATLLGNDLDAITKVKTDLEHTGLKLFKGKSAKDYSNQLEKRLDEILNNQVKQLIVTQYSEALGRTAVERNHRTHWSPTQMSLERFVCGPNKREVISEIVENLAEKYYNRLSTELSSDYKNQCTRHDCTVKPVIEECIDFELAGGRKNVLKQTWERVKHDFDYEVSSHEKHIQNIQLEEFQVKMREEEIYRSRQDLEQKVNYMEETKNKESESPSILGKLFSFIPSFDKTFTFGLGAGVGAAVFKFIPSILPASL